MYVFTSSICIPTFCNIDSFNHIFKKKNNFKSAVRSNSFTCNLFHCVPITKKFKIWDHIL